MFHSPPSSATGLPSLVFAHANGFTGSSYQSFLQPLENRFAVHTLDRLGHHPSYPVTPNWQLLREELLAYLAEFPGPVIGVGHSMGGVVMAMAALKAPKRFRCLVMLDPPLMVGMDAMALKLAKRFNLVDRITPAGKSRGRRASWPSHDAMHSDLRVKGLFRRFTPQALEDYVKGATRVDEDGRVHLIFEPRIETEIFRHLPDHLWRLPRKLEVPTALLAGSESDLITPYRRKRLERRGLRVDTVPGGHMYPMEHPEETRRILLATLEQLLETS
ncbi:alpha/beta fold hydrolase [Pistricoccus aurantiacus]|uniref:alpha/beta fold hydrolase n=1 Tax=Pistricoccus aurantiacus TaxID=1883414 RepID=UPI003644ECD0